MLEWDEQKDRQNRLKHGLSFQEAAQLLTGDADYLEIFDITHSIDEDRFIAIGPIRSGVITVVWTQRDEHTVRIISARRATAREQALYEAWLENLHD